MDNRVKCCYCGRKLKMQGQVPHQEKCLFGPMGEVAQQFMQRHANNGAAPSSSWWRDSEERKAVSLPSADKVVNQFGTWEKFTSWCGLAKAPRYQTRNFKHRTKERIDERVILDRIDGYIARARQLTKEIDDSLHSLKGCRQRDEIWKDADTGELVTRTVTMLR